MTSAIEQHIRNLAQQHNTTSHPTSLDQMGHSITRLSGDDVALDEVEMLIVHLGQQGHITGYDVIQYAHAWRKEKSNA